MIAVIDYDVGNLFSLQASLSALSVDSVLTRDPEVIHRADGIILPGVGAFGDAAGKLEQYGLKDCLRSEAASGKMMLGICLGMQLLFEESEEYGRHEGLGLLKGKVRSLREAIQNPEAIVPHMGWNELETARKDELTGGLPEHPFVYFVHSYYADECEDSLVAYAEYEGVKVPGIVRRENVVGMQFHPEKSGGVGLALLKAFADMCGRKE
ncbi:MAG: imidazole glycerol phosphate synthase subunit HisH [Firmicutes bacterium]|nr:imidazole glycerol phosphate synthase subunit HisH [Bacillota bacterium]